MSENKNVRIKDIAEMAGVSVATVDRVLHKRGKISKKAYEKVMEALENSGYKPNLLASTLGAKKTYKIAAFIPDPVLDDYWTQSGAGIFKAKEDWTQYNVRIESFYFNLFDKSSFNKVAQKVIEYQPDSVLLAPIFHQESLAFFDYLRSADIPYVLFNSNIPEADPLSFIGQDLYRSGRVGAELISTKLSKSGNIGVFHISEDIHNSVHLKEKEDGFRDYFKDNKQNGFKILSYEFDYNKSDFERELTAVLSKDKLSGIFVSASKGTYLAASILDKVSKQDIVLVGYDLLKDNIHYMYDGVIDFLINQNPRKQSFLGISYLVNYLLFKKQPPVSELFPLEIITRENLKSYLYSGLY